MKKINKEILIKFRKTTDPKKLDEMIYNFEKTMNQLNYNYFLKESENPFIYLIEYSKPEDLIKQLQQKEYEDLEIVDMMIVKCTINNLNHIIDVILKKIRNKLQYTDTYNLTCHMDSYITCYSKDEFEEILNENLKDLIYIQQNSNNPTWNINIYIIGEISAINITRSNKNRNKFNQYMVKT
ncbi:MAG: hypothetical protein PUF18_01370 [Methanosphaera sp.]|uniref:hypothetical protein n=1 Tax=Methanosphaera sp. TaxID=2666342 RepID=UPI00261CD853|nr:hypothetical protein [Methanosphaera sp.]MDD6534150.1 hypothetical protein [Methanosphaera sp.]